MQITVLASHTAQKSNIDHRIFQSSLAFLLRQKSLHVTSYEFVVHREYIAP